MYDIDLPSMHRGFSMYRDTTISPVRGNWLGCMWKTISQNNE